MKHWAVVVPSNRPDRLEQFKEAWAETFSGITVDLIVVEDHSPWPGIPEFIPKRTDMIRSWGFYLAHQKTHVSHVLSLDDDTLPPYCDILEAYGREFDRGAPFSPYFSVGSQTSTGLEMRGFPYEGRHAEVAFQYGGWHGSADLDAATQLATKPQHCEFGEAVVPVPARAAVTCCAMNFCFHVNYALLAWQLPLFDGRYNRFGDIWSGLIQKRCLDALGKVMLINGQASVVHDRASDPFTNLEREQPGMQPNEMLWSYLQAPVTGRTVRQVFQTVTNQFSNYFRNIVGDWEYANYFLRQRDAWMELFE